MDAQTALNAFAAGLAESGMTEEELAALGAQVRRGAQMLSAISLRAQADTLISQAATLNDQATAAERAARIGA